MKKIFGTDGVRCIINQEPMTAETCLKIAKTTGYLLSSNTREKKRVVISKDTRLSGYLFEPLLTAGFISMGILPAIFCLVFFSKLTLADLGLTFIYKTAQFSIFWILGLSVLIIPLVYFSAKKPKNLVNYPQIRAKVWTKKMVFINALGWFLYLFGYEFLFRGILLIPLIEPLGMWPAIAINIALYSATHIPKGLDETIGAIPLGFVLCLLTISSGTIWIAFIVHVVMAWTNTFTALKFHPEMNLKK